jgi:acyl-CoA synthetase (AMP-forming)/AMP-acid ligase II
MTTIPGILQENAARWPDRPALIATSSGRDVALSFAELESAAEGFAARLVKKGIRRGDPVLVFVPMSLELYIALLGLFRIGATAVFLDPSSGLGHINACCKKLPPSGMISVWPLRGLRPFVRGLRKIRHVFAPPRPVPASLSSLPEGPAPDDAALITFTSGSTGEPKAAVRSHRFLIAQHRALESSIQLEPGERDLTTLPVFVLANLASGVTSILPDAKISRPGSVDAARLAKQIARLQPSRSGGSPAFYQRLAEEPASLAGFRKIYTGGAPVFPALLQKLQTLTPSGEVVAVYGSTEAEPIAHMACRDITPADWRAMQEGRGLLAGIPIPEIQLRLVRDQWGGPLGDSEPLAPGEAGEILVTGDHVLKGYLHGQGDAETKVALEGEIWHRTGDAGYLDAGGRLWLLGRCAARVQDARGVVYPFAVECVAMSFPFVRRAAFVATAGRRLLVVEGETLTKNRLEELKTRAASLGVDEILPLRNIPVDARHNAKINYPELRERLRRQGLARD